MTEVASGVPGQRQEDAPAEAPQEGTPGATPNQEKDPAEAAAERGALEQLGDRAGDAVERAAAASGRVASQVVERLRNAAELVAERGTTSIADEVVEKIAGIAAREVPGVYDLGGDVARFFASVKERIGLEESEEGNRGIAVRLDGGTAVINVTLVIEFGYVVHSVTEKVRAKVVGSVENLLGLDVIEVNIRVDDVHVEETAPVGNDEERAADYQV
jgi:uncharacterized alkaline shock family protein YloU